MPKPALSGIACNAASHLAADGLSSEVQSGIRVMIASVAEHGWTGAIASLTASTGMLLAPAVGYAAMLGGSAYLQYRQGKATGDELKAHFADLHQALSDRADNVDQLAVKLDVIYQRKRFVWAKLDGGDKRAISRQVTDAMADQLEANHAEVAHLFRDTFDRLDKIAIDISDTKILADDTNNQAHDIRTRVASLQSQFESVFEPDKRVVDMAFEANLSAQIQGRPREVTQEELDAADTLLRKSSDRLAKAKSAILMEEYERADEFLALETDAIHELEERRFEFYTVKGNRYLSAQQFDDAIEPYEQACDCDPDNLSAKIRLGVCLLMTQRGHVAAARRRSIALLENCAEDWPSSAPTVTRVDLYNFLGLAYMEQVDGNVAENCNQAMRFFGQAIDLMDDQTEPSTRAVILTNAGIAHDRTFKTNGEVEYLNVAISLMEKAVEISDPGLDSHGWANARNNLAVTLQQLGLAEAPNQPDRIIELYRDALSVWSIRFHPLDWARAQMGLAGRHLQLAAEGNRDHLPSAFAALDRAESVISEYEHPRLWANIQLCRGDGCGLIPSGNLIEDITNASEYYRSALDVFTVYTEPIEHATVRYKLASMLAEIEKSHQIPLAEGSKEIDAAFHFNAAQDIFYEHSVPQLVSEIDRELKELLRYRESL